MASQKAIVSLVSNTVTELSYRFSENRWTTSDVKLLMECLDCCKFGKTVYPNLILMINHIITHTKLHEQFGWEEDNEALIAARKKVAKVIQKSRI